LRDMPKPITVFSCMRPACRRIFQRCGHWIRVRGLVSLLAWRPPYLSVGYSTSMLDSKYVWYQSISAHLVC
jgi:hypothetical protein